MINPVARAARAVIGRASEIGRTTERQRLPDAAAILGALSVPVVLLDADNRFRYVNHAAEQFLGVSAAQLAPLRLTDLVPPIIRCIC
jgi:two-component system, NtrC family, nitrogen regulation sensor histidine kinase GlnL